MNNTISIRETENVDRYVILNLLDKNLIKIVTFSIAKKMNIKSSTPHFISYSTCYTLDTKVSDEVKPMATCNKSTQIGEYPTQKEAILPGKGNVCR